MINDAAIRVFTDKWTAGFLPLFLSFYAAYSSPARSAYEAVVQLEGQYL